MLFTVDQNAKSSALYRKRLSESFVKMLWRTDGVWGNHQSRVQPAILNAENGLIKTFKPAGKLIAGSEVIGVFRLSRWENVYIDNDTKDQIEPDDPDQTRNNS
jgi:hypothetical protein